MENRVQGSYYPQGYGPYAYGQGYYPPAMGYNNPYMGNYNMYNQATGAMYPPLFGNRFGPSGKVFERAGSWLQQSGLPFDPTTGLPITGMLGQQPMSKFEVTKSGMFGPKEFAMYFGDQGDGEYKGADFGDYKNPFTARAEAEAAANAGTSDNPNIDRRGRLDYNGDSDNINPRQELRRTNKLERQLNRGERRYNRAFGHGTDETQPVLETNTNVQLVNPGGHAKGETFNFPETRRAATEEEKKNWPTQAFGPKMTEAEIEALGFYGTKNENNPQYQGLGPKKYGDRSMNLYKSKLNNKTYYMNPDTYEWHWMPEGEHTVFDGESGFRRDGGAQLPQAQMMGEFNAGVSDIPAGYYRDNVTGLVKNNNGMTYSPYAGYGYNTDKIMDTDWTNQYMAYGGIPMAQYGFSSGSANQYGFNYDPASMDSEETQFNNWWGGLGSSRMDEILAQQERELQDMNAYDVDIDAENASMDAFAESTMAKKQPWAVKGKIKNMFNVDLERGVNQFNRYAGAALNPFERADNRISAPNMMELTGSERNYGNKWYQNKGRDPETNSGLSFINQMGAKLQKKKGGSTYKEGAVTYMSAKQVEEFIKQGGKLEFIK